MDRRAASRWPFARGLPPRRHGPPRARRYLRVDYCVDWLESARPREDVRPPDCQSGLVTVRQDEPVEVGPESVPQAEASGAAYRMSPALHAPVRRLRAACPKLWLRQTRSRERMIQPV